MTLIQVGNSDGLVGRCDAKCYDAEGPDCDCVCHGRNHGAGLRQAMDNTREMAKALLQEYSQQGQKLVINEKELQAELFSQEAS